MQQNYHYLALLYSIAHVQVVECILDGYTNTKDVALATSNDSIVLLRGSYPSIPLNDGGSCGLLVDLNLQRTEDIAFAVNKINADPDILPPGVKLAFYISDPLASWSTPRSTELSISLLKASQSAIIERLTACQG